MFPRTDSFRKYARTALDLFPQISISEKASSIIDVLSKLDYHLLSDIKTETELIHEETASVKETVVNANAKYNSFCFSQTLANDLYLCYVYIVVT